MGTDVSINPMSSTRKRIIFGLVFSTANKAKAERKMKIKETVFIEICLLPLSQNLAFLDWPPLADFSGQSGHNFGVVFGQILFLLGVLKQIE